jgi:predicted lipoprotein
MRAARWLLTLAVVGAAAWLFPPFHVVPLKTAAAADLAAAFDPARFAATFWTNRLLPALPQTVKAETLLPAIQADPAAARTRYARGTGLGGSYFYFLSGTGRVAAVSEDEVLLVVTSGTNAEVSLPAGLIFGNALRDGTGLLNASDYPNSQDFNGLAEALNHLAETQAVPPLRACARPGAKIFFAGCAEVADESTDLKPLKVIPVAIAEK